MAKVAELIEGAYRLTNTTPGGEKLEAWQTAEGLRVLNQMLASWSVDRQGIYAITKESFPMVANTAVYTIGPGGDFDTVRPNRITYAFVRQNEKDYRVRLVDREWQAGRQNKTTLTDRPWELLYEKDFPIGTLTFFPIPNSTYDIHLQSVKPLAVYSSANDDLALPPEYEAAIEYNLAIALANRNGQTVGQETASFAQDSLKKLKRLHSDPVRRTRTSIIGSGVQRDYDISGDFFFG